MKKTGTEKYIPIIEDGGYMEDIKGNRDDRYIKGFVQTVKEKYNIEESEAREILKDFIQVIIDASDYLFSKNHSDPYSMIGFFIGWLRYYYTLELLTSALNVYVDNSEKMSEIKEYIKSKGIEIKQIKFGKSRAEYFMDKEENAIYQGIGSVKYCNETIAEELYQLSQENTYDNFLDLLIDIHAKTSVNSRQLEILILLNFFSDFGENRYLQMISNLYDDLYNRSQIKKADIESGKVKIDYDYFDEECYDKETEKLYKGLHMDVYIRRIMRLIPNEPITFKEQMIKENEYLGNIIYTRPDAPDNIYFVMEMKGKNKYKPVSKLYRIKTGEVISAGISSENIFMNNPFREHNILRVTKMYEKKETKKKEIDGEIKFVPTGKIEYRSLSSYTVH